MKRKDKAGKKKGEGKTEKKRNTKKINEKGRKRKWKNE